jgi:2-keto-3-deoxy-L-rhamnonate aldolase RhmA
MKPNRFKKVLAEGRIPIGHLIWEFGTLGIAKIAEAADLDFVMIDMEHTRFTSETIAELIGWFKATPVAPFVRVPQNLYHFLARTMDAGALGVMVANVENAEQARQIVSAVKFAPEGSRGVGLGTPHTDYLSPDPVSYFKEANENTTVICMIESPAGLRNLDEIAGTPGVDVLWVGHFDLTQSMGIPGQFDHSDFLQALRHVTSAAKRHGKSAGINPTRADQAERWHDLGFNVLSWGTDSGVYRDALSEGVQQLRKHVAARVEPE